MTAYSFLHQKERIIIGSDTLVYLADQVEVRPLGFCSKVIPLPHLHCAIFSRGQKWIEAQVVAALQCSYGLRTIEDVADVLPDLLRHHTAEYGDMIDYEGDASDLLVLEMGLAGWSEREKRMRHFRWSCVENYSMNHIGDGDATYSAAIYPWPPLPPEFLPELRGVPIDDAMVKMVKAIDAFFVTKPELCGAQRVGGEVQLTTVTPTEIKQRSVYRFANADAVGVAAAAIRARIERGEVDGAAAVRDGLTRREDARTSDGELLADVAAMTRGGEPMNNAQPTGEPMNRQQRRAAERAGKKRRAAA